LRQCVGPRKTTGTEIGDAQFGLSRHGRYTTTGARSLTIANRRIETTG